MNGMALETPNRKTVLLEGSVSVRAAIEAGNRTVYKVFVDEHKKEKRDRKTLALLSYLKARGVPFEPAARNEITALIKEYSRADAGTTHGGVAALVSERRTDDLENLLSAAKPGEYFVYLDGIEDPFNLGYSLRSLYAMGCAGVILPQRNLAESAGVTARASAGASEFIPLAEAPKDDEETVRLLRKYGVGIVCSAVASDAVPLRDFAPDAPFVLFIGGEKRGISPVFMEAADTKVFLPYVRASVRYSLPTASVCAIAAETLASYASMGKSAGQGHTASQSAEEA